MFVFLIDSNPMITDWLERQAKARSERFYSMSSLLDAPYFIQDLLPDVVVLDGKTVQKDAEEFIAAIEDHPHLRVVPVIGLGDALPEWCGALNLKGHLPKPLDPSKFHDDVKKLLG